MTLKERTRQILIDTLVEEHHQKYEDIKDLDTRELKHRIAYLQIKESKWF